MDISSLAADLLEALDHTTLIETLTSRDPDLDVSAAYAVSAEILRRRVARGETPVGRKIGFTNRTIWDEYGVYEPIWATVYRGTLTQLEEPRGTLNVGHLAQPRIEPEIVLHFARTPSADLGEAEILECIDWIAHGYEIVQSHFPDWKFLPADTIAAFGLHGALVVGPPRPVSELNDLVGALRTFEISLACNGEVRATGGGFNVLDSPLLAAQHFLGLLATQRAFRPIQPGEVVTTGTLTAALPIAPGESWSTQLSGLDLPGLTLLVE